MFLTQIPIQDYKVKAWSSGQKKTLSQTITSGHKIFLMHYE
jgi:hypothetical protein